MNNVPFSDNSLPTEKRRLEGRRMLKRRPEKDMLGCFCQVADSGEECNLVYASYRSSLDLKGVRKGLIKQELGISLKWYE